MKNNNFKDLRKLGDKIQFYNIKDKENIILTEKQVSKIFRGLFPETINRIFYIIGCGTDSIKRVSKDEVIIYQLITQELFISFLKKKDEKVEKEITLPTKLLDAVPKEKYRWKYLVLLDYLFNKGYDPFTEKIKPVYLSSFSFKRLLIDYYEYKDFLINVGIITVNHSYCTTTHKSKSYLLNKEFLNRELSSETITVKASKAYEETDKKQVKELKRNKEYFDYLRSEKWLSFRESILEERGRKCEKCSTPNFLTLHHITYKNIFNEKPEDVLVLCEGCHDKEHGIPPRTI